MGWLQFVYWKPLWDSSRIHNNAMRNGAGAGVCAASGVDFMIFLLFVCLCSWLGWVSVAWSFFCLLPQLRLSRAKWSFHFLLDSSALRAERQAPWPFALHVKFTTRPPSGRTSIKMYFLSEPHLREIAQGQGDSLDSTMWSLALSNHLCSPVHHIQGLNWDFEGGGAVKSGGNCNVLGKM